MPPMEGHKPFISCTSCRTKKVKCPGEKPICSRCQAKSLDCRYDVEIRRRGPDKYPGSRLKGKVFHQSEGNNQVLSQTQIGESSTSNKGHQVTVPYPARSKWVAGIALTTTKPLEHAPQPGNATRSHPYNAVGRPRIRSEGNVVRQELPATAGDLPMYRPPGHIDSTRAGWWDWILIGYSKNKRQAAETVTQLCRVFFNDSHLWYASISRPLFWKSTLDPTSAIPRAPHVILSILAHVTFRESGRDIDGQWRALRFIDEARGIIEYSLLAGSKDPSLLQAALLLTAFEMNPHILYSKHRSYAALRYLDRCVLACGSTTLDDDSPYVTCGLLNLPHSSSPFPGCGADAGDGASAIRPRGELATHTMNWVISPPWNPDWSVGDIQKEEIRRMVWVASNIATASALVISRDRVKDLAIGHPEKYLVLFPGEAYSIDQGETEKGKTSLWAMYHRAAMIIQRLLDGHLSTDERNSAKSEVSHLRIRLQGLKPDGLNNYLWQTREYMIVLNRILNLPRIMTPMEWFNQETAYVTAILHPPPGKPNVVQRAQTCWIWTVKIVVALEYIKAAPALMVVARSLIDTCFAAIHAIMAEYPCATLEQDAARLTMAVRKVYDPQNPTTSARIEQHHE